MSRRNLLLVGIARRDGRANDQADWRELGQSCGYTGHRDLAGFFGGRAPSMVRLPDGSRVLTEAGWARVRSI